MVLLRVDVDVLAAIGEVQARDAAPGVIAVKVDGHKDLAKAGAHLAADPVQPRTLPDAPALVAKVEDIVAPVLQANVAQL
jgi:hypothetical protein